MYIDVMNKFDFQMDRGLQVNLSYDLFNRQGFRRL